MPSTHAGGGLTLMMSGVTGDAGGADDLWGAADTQRGGDGGRDGGSGGPEHNVASARPGHHSGRSVPG